MKLVKIKRQTYDIGIFGKKGSGKTMILSLFGYLFYKNGCTIFSNFPLNYPHIFIGGLLDIDKVFDMDYSIEKKFLGDDFERWFHSYSTKSKVSDELSNLLLDFGKVSCSLLYTSKRSMAINIGLRDSTSEFWFPELKQAFSSDNKVVNSLLRDYLNFLYVDIVRYDENLELLPNIRINYLDKICGLYDTLSIVGGIRG